MSENPLGQASTWSLVAEGYEQETMPMFKTYAEDLLLKIEYPKKCKRALDVACGPGTLSLLLKDRTEKVDAVDYAIDMLRVFNRRIDEQEIKNVTTQEMNGQDLKFATGTFDFAFSMFGLMFFADRLQGFRELHRVLKAGGRAGVTSWAPIAKSTMMQLVVGAMGFAFGAPTSQESKTGIETLEDPDVFKKEMEQAGFKNVQITESRGQWPIANIEQFLDSIEKGAAPITLMKQKHSAEEWQAKRQKMAEYMNQQLPKLPAELFSTAFIGVGEK